MDSKDISPAFLLELFFYLSLLIELENPNFTPKTIIRTKTLKFAAQITRENIMKVLL